MPRRSKFIKSHFQMLAQLGSSAFERYERVSDGGGTALGRRHIGWRWPCDCSTFARPEGDYLWVPCRRHDGSPHRHDTGRLSIAGSKRTS